MTYSTPPGWHPDPGHTGDGPRQERWWDGSAWTDQLRSADPAAWGAPGAPPYPAAPPPAPRRRGRRIAIGATAVVVAAALAGGFYLLGRSGGDDDNASSAPSAAPSQPGGGGDNGGLGGDGGLGGGNGGLGGGGNGGGDTGGSGGGDDGGGSTGGGQNGGPQQPQTEAGFATDAASGISIPVPDGWKGQSGTVGAAVSTGDYKCPGDASKMCERGGVSSSPAAALNNQATTAKATAEKDIAANAKESYGGSVYGKITSHQQLKSEAVTVAGQQGYLVRWKVVTAKGDDGYVQSLAFPSPSSPKLLVLVRSGFDVNTKAPKLAVMDQITKGIKAAAGAAGGSGQGA